MRLRVATVEAEKLQQERSLKSAKVKGWWWFTQSTQHTGLSDVLTYYCVFNFKKGIIS